MDKETIALELHRIGVLKFGDFTYKSGIKSPMYLDLRLFVSHPKVLKLVARAYAEMIKDIEFDRMIGVAYAAMPIAGAISLELERPWIFVRKEGLAKAYGLGKAIEGEYHAGERGLIIEDLVTKGTSMLEVLDALASSALEIKHAAVLIDYEKGGKAALASRGIELHAFMTTRELIDIMHQAKKIDDDKYQQCLDFLAS